jgi:hypothetical protein
MFFDFSFCGNSKAPSSFFIFSQISSAIQNAKVKKLRNSSNARYSSICSFLHFGITKTEVDLAFCQVLSNADCK